VQFSTTTLAPERLACPLIGMVATIAGGVFQLNGANHTGWG
jgi:hypothetical protein